MWSIFVRVSSVSTDSFSQLATNNSFQCLLLPSFCCCRHFTHLTVKEKSQCPLLNIGFIDSVAADFSHTYLYNVHEKSQCLLLHCVRRNRLFYIPIVKSNPIVSC